MSGQINRITSLNGKYVILKAEEDANKADTVMSACGVEAQLETGRRLAHYLHAALQGHTETWLDRL